MVEWYKDKASRRFLFMSCLTGSFMLIELIFGITTNSLALISDAFHMMSDLLAIVIGYYASRKAGGQDKHPRLSFGFARSEVVAALVNSVFLLSVCLFIVFEAIRRFFENPEIRNSTSLMIVGAVGLFINIIGLFIFSGSGGHGHSHAGANGSGGAGGDGHGHGHGGSGSSANARAVFWHVMGDALGSVVVVGVGAFIRFTNVSGRHYADPIASLFISFVIAWNAWPIAKETAIVLLQAVPSHIKPEDIADDLIAGGGGAIVAVHELHIWELVNAKLIASAHILLAPSVVFNEVTAKIKEVFHKHGVHIVTLQPEWGTSDPSPGGGGKSLSNDQGDATATVPALADGGASSCLLRCIDDCNMDVCCAPANTTDTDPSTPAQPPADGLKARSRGYSKVSPI